MKKVFYHRKKYVVTNLPVTILFGATSNGDITFTSDLNILAAQLLSAKKLLPN